QILESALDPRADVEPRDVARQDGGSAGTLRERRGQVADRGGPQARRPKGDQRAPGDRPRRLAGEVSGTEQVHHQLAAVRRDERRAQDPGLDQPRPGGRIALTYEGPAGPNDREGEWFDDGH